MKYIYITLMLMSISFAYCQDVVKTDNQKTKQVKQEGKSKKVKSKTICVHKGEYDGCGTTIAEAKQALAMAIEVGANKKKADSTSKTK